MNKNFSFNRLQNIWFEHRIKLRNLKDEQAWTTRFEATTDDQWDRLAEMVRQDIAKGETVPLDEVFPT